MKQIGALNYENWIGIQLKEWKYEYNCNVRIKSDFTTFNVPVTSVQWMIASFFKIFSVVCAIEKNQLLLQLIIYDVCNVRMSRIFGMAWKFEMHQDIWITFGNFLECSKNSDSTLRKKGIVLAVSKTFIFWKYYNAFWCPAIRWKSIWTELVDYKWTYASISIL